MRMTYVLCLVILSAYLLGLGWPLDVTHPSTMLLYGFSHYHWLHMALNVLGVLTLGLGVERAGGKDFVAVVFLGAVFCGALAHMIAGPNAPVIGASAGVMGLLASYALLHPDKRVMILVFPMSALTALGLITTVEAIMAIGGYLPTIAHWAHVGGIYGGALATFIYGSAYREVR